MVVGRIRRPDPPAPVPHGDDTPDLGRTAQPELSDFPVSAAAFP